jgi:pimeloyl-ACP methyl ester carboxylesterase
MNLKSWLNQGQFVHIGNHQIFYVDSKGEKPVLAILHGYPTCSFDYWKVMPLLTKKYRVIVHDHLGFGLSDKPSNSAYLLKEQADIALELWKYLKLDSIHLLAHNYGTSVATEILAKELEESLSTQIERVTLCNGSMLIHLSELRPIQRMLKSKWIGGIVARLSTENTFQRNMRKLWAHPKKYDVREMSELWKLLIHNKGRSVLPKITRYIDQRYTNYDRWIGALKKSDLPIHILWADKDPVAVIQMANELEKIIPNNKKTILKDLGHYPMIEDPVKWAEAVLST